MKRPLVIAAVTCALVLALAWGVSAWLHEEVAPAMESAPQRAAHLPRSNVPRGEREAPSDPEAEPVGRARREPAEPGARVDAGPAIAAESAPSPFATEHSPEIDYAFTLLFGPDSTPDRWRNAAEVFERCLKQVPGNQRCYRGLVAAQLRLAGQDAGEYEPELRAPPPPPDDGNPRRMLINPSIDLGQRAVPRD